MSNIIPPLISSSPPPMVANLEEEDDDFGEFPTAFDVSYNCDALSLPPTPHGSPKKLANGNLKTDINSNRNVVSESNKMFPKDYQDKRKTDAIKNEVNSTNNLENTPCSLSVDNFETETQSDVPTSDEKTDLKSHANKQDTEFNKLEVPENIYFEEPPELPPDDMIEDDEDFASFSQSLELDKNKDISVPFVVNQEVLTHLQDTTEPDKSDVQSVPISDAVSVIENNSGTTKPNIKFEIITDPTTTDCVSESELSSVKYSVEKLNLNDDCEESVGKSENISLNINNESCEKIEEGDEKTLLYHENTDACKDNQNFTIAEDDFDDFTSFTPINNQEMITSNIPESLHDITNEVFDDFKSSHAEIDDDFSEFKSSIVISDILEETSSNESENTSELQIDANFDDFMMADEDFDNFRTSVINPTFEETFPESSLNSNIKIETRVDIFGAPYEVALIRDENKTDLDDDDFGDFDDFQTHSSARRKEFEQPHQVVGDFGAFVQNFPLDLKGNTEKIEDVVVGMFPKQENVVVDGCKLDFLEGNFIFEQMQDITETNAVSFVWSKSSSQKALLKALNIDTRNILHGGGWNLSMPKFAANLSAAPLEPVKTEILTPITANVSFSATPSSQSDIPTAQFDWSGSGLTNPLDCNQKEQTKRETDSVKSLQFSELEIESAGDDFGIFQASKTEMTGSNVFPLRETHISTQIDPEPGWLKPTILTPVMPRKDIEETAKEEEFSDFQMGVVEVKKHETEFQALPSIIGANVQKFAFETALEPLKPTILQPEVVNKAPAQINWPDPGLSEEQLAHIELSISNLKTEPQKTPKTAPEQVEDDDWSEFVSNQDVKLKSPLKRTATPELQLCIPQLSQIQPPKQPIPVITPHGLIQTKIPSNSYHKINRNNYPVLKPLQNQPTDGYQPSIISNQFAKQTSYVLPSYQNSSTGDDDDWTDFISSQPPPPTNGLKNKSITPNIITNPHFEQNNAYKPNSVLRNGVNTRLANISLPELDFVAPNTKMKQ